MRPRKRTRAFTRFHSTGSNPAKLVCQFGVPQIESADIERQAAVAWMRVSQENTRYRISWILNQTAVRLMSTHPLVREWAEPYRRRMHANKVRTTLAQRLLVGIYIVLLRGEVFSMECCLGMA